MSVETAPPTPLQKDFENLQIGEKLDSTPTKPATAEPRKLPFTQPALSAKRPGRVQLTEVEQSKYDIVEEYLQNLTTLPVSSAKKNKEFKPLTERERFWLTRECILRYLRATKWNVNEAKKRLEGTIVWRREYGTDEITAELVEPEVSYQAYRWLTTGVDGETDITWIRYFVASLSVSHSITTEYRHITKTNSTVGA
jgi:CRAL/TRIO, N-terminal domain